MIFQVFDGTNTLQENLIVSFCDETSIPLPLLTSGNSLLLQYTVTQVSRSQPSLTFKVERKPCQYTILSLTITCAGEVEFIRGMSRLRQAREFEVKIPPKEKEGIS